LLVFGHDAIVASLAASIVALGLIGAGTSLFTGRGALFSAVRQIVIGALAALITYGMGRFAGMALTG
jgi:vacuolar iron transporter family protein